MSDPKDNSTPNVAAVFCIALICWLVLVPVVNQIYLPLGENATGAISVATLENTSPYTDYLKYFILLFVPPLVGAIALVINPKWVDGFFGVLQKAIAHPFFLIPVTALLILSWTINKHLFGLQAPLLDSFHEGEFLGFLPNFTALENPFANTVFVHGFGLNVFPSLLAHTLGYSNTLIAKTRLFVIGLRIVSTLGWFWVLWEITQCVRFKKQSNLLFFLGVSLLFAFLEGIFFYVDETRSSFFVIQFALMLRFFRVGDYKPIQGKVLPIIVGFSIPLSFLYVYDRAIYFLGIYLSAVVLSFGLEKRVRKRWLAGSVLGIGTALILLAILLGFQGLGAIGWQILYWGKYGRYISFRPLPPLEMTFDSQWFWMSMLIQTSVLVYLAIALKKTQFHLRSFIQKHFLTLLLLSAACIYMRSALDRSDIGHAGHSALVSFLLLFYLSLRGVRKYLDDTVQIPNETRGFIRLSFGVIMLVLLASEPNFAPEKAWEKVAVTSQAIATADEKIVQPDYLEAVNALQPEIDKQSCFYTLTSEGLWYSLFDKPSCSKFSYTYYSKPTSAQKIVVRELKQTQPDIILLTNNMWSNTIDGIPTSDSVSQIYQYILQEYQPYRLVQSHWFWKRRDRDYRLATSNTIQGVLDNIPETEIWKGQTIAISGWAILPQQNKPPDAVFLSYGSDNKLIAVDPVNTPRPDVALALSNPNYTNSGWKLRIPTTVLPSGKTVLKVWGYDAQSQELIQIGDEISLNVLPYPSVPQRSRNKWIR
ncbi:hypothetical protein [Phormidium sp. CCY1219]|uniref:hypothetical protein n=1 Tax=Phormidium sp. CCY1219 TaxID=2886104 RepID=UPI002D1EADA9|nr:hypothetical protein [Phormidium sp. CCY1219]MEB3830438.1 hypothetical protein [Phormidium sp. CCY1219]